MESAQPMLYGGGMVPRVTEDGFEAESPPHKFEAGTPNIEGALGMGAAAEFLRRLGMRNVHEHSKQLARALADELRSIEGIRVFPTDSPEGRMPVASFTVGAMPADDLAAILCNRHNIMVRSGVHCAEPLVRHLGHKGLARVSLYLYNTLDEVSYIGESLRQLSKVLA
jgi:cysteine desulfurase/selenocysteine lyase